MKREVRVLSSKEVFKRAIITVNEIVLQHTRMNGTLSDPLTRLVMDRGDCAAVLLHDTAADEIVLTEQFRPATYERDTGWILEIPAGMVASDEDEEQCIRRETREETGYALQQLQRIGTFYLSPGGSSERVHLFYAQASATDQVADGGGLASEGEDIRIVRVSVQETIDRARDGRINDAKTLIAVQWLAMMRKNPATDGRGV